MSGTAVYGIVIFESLVETALGLFEQLVRWTRGKPSSKQVRGVGLSREAPKLQRHT